MQGATWDSGAEIRSVPWSDVNGLPRGWGATFRGRRAVLGGFGGSAAAAPFDPADPFRGSRKGCWFHFAVPTPVIVGGRPPSRLTKVFVLWEATGGAQPIAVHAYDAGQRFAPVAVSPLAPGETAPTGRNGHADLREGKSMFTLGAHEVKWGVGVSVAVAFPEEGEITFFSVGADFDA